MRQNERRIKLVRVGDAVRTAGWLKGELTSFVSCCCSFTQSCLTLWDSMDCDTPGFPVLQHLLELAQTHVHCVGDTIPPSHPLSSPYPLAFYLSQHQDLFQRISSSHQVAKGLEFQLQRQSFQWIQVVMRVKLNMPEGWIWSINYFLHLQIRQWEEQ